MNGRMVLSDRIGELAKKLGAVVVGASVGASVGAAVGASVGAAVGARTQLSL